MLIILFELRSLARQLALELETLSSPQLDYVDELNTPEVNYEL